MDYLYYVSKIFVSTPNDPFDDSRSSSNSSETKPSPNKPTKKELTREKLDSYFEQVKPYLEKQRKLTECGTGSCFVSNIQNNSDDICIKVNLINRSVYELSRNDKNKNEQKWSFSVLITKDGFQLKTIQSRISRQIYSSFKSFLQDFLNDKAVSYPKGIYTISPTGRPQVKKVINFMKKYFGKPLKEFNYDIVKISRACLSQMGFPSPHSLYFIKQLGEFEPYWLSSSYKQLGFGSFKSVKELSHAFTNERQALYVGGVDFSCNLFINKHKIMPFKAYYDLLDMITENPEEATHLAVPKIQSGKVYQSSVESEKRVFMLQDVLYKDLFDFPPKNYPLDQFFSLLVQMVHSVQQLHAFGFIHTDVKLDNFMVTQKSDPHLVLIDYDGLKSIDIDSNYYVTSGTLDYLPRCCIPGYAKLPGDCGPKLDIFALIISIITLSSIFIENTKERLNSSLDSLRELIDNLKSIYTLGNLYNNYIECILENMNYGGYDSFEDPFILKQRDVDTSQIRKELNEQALSIVKNHTERLSGLDTFKAAKTRRNAKEELTTLLTVDLLMNLPTLDDLMTLIQDYKERLVASQ